MYSCTKHSTPQRAQRHNTDQWLAGRPHNPPAAMASIKIARCLAGSSATAAGGRPHHEDWDPRSLDTPPHSATAHTQTTYNPAPCDHTTPVQQRLEHHAREANTTCQRADRSTDDARTRYSQIHSSGDASSTLCTTTTADADAAGCCCGSAPCAVRCPLQNLPPPSVCLSWHRHSPTATQAPHPSHELHTARKHVHKARMDPNIDAPVPQQLPIDVPAAVAALRLDLQQQRRQRWWWSQQQRWDKAQHTQ